MDTENCRPDHYHYVVRSDTGERVWHADNTDHAREQHRDTFPEETILEVRRID